MRLHRKRRLNKLHCLTIELHETQSHALMRQGFLSPAPMKQSGRLFMPSSTAR
jgi:hypothetical protein